MKLLRLKELANRIIFTLWNRGEYVNVVLYDSLIKVFFSIVWLRNSCKNPEGGHDSIANNSATEMEEHNQISSVENNPTSEISVSGYSATTVSSITT